MSFFRSKYGFKGDLYACVEVCLEVGGFARPKDVRDVAEHLALVGLVCPGQQFLCLEQEDGGCLVVPAGFHSCPLCVAGGRLPSLRPLLPPGEGGGGPVKGSEGPKACPLTGEVEPPSCGACVEGGCVSVDDLISTCTSDSTCG